MPVGLQIKELRVKKGLTQQELADQTELSARTIQRIENGEVDPRAYSLQMIAKALEVDYRIFIEDESKSEGQGKYDSIILGMLHLSGMFPLFFASILIWKRKRHLSDKITDHFKDIIGMQLTIWLMFILPGTALYFFFEHMGIINKAPFLIFGGIALGLILSVTNAIQVFHDKPYKRFSFLKSKD